MIPHNRPALGEREAAAAAQTVRSAWVANGPQCRAFEDELCAYLGLPADSVVLASSGTAALFLALLHLRPPDGSVRLPAYACAALANAAAMAGLRYEFADTRAGSPNAAPDEQASLSVCVSMYGLLADVPSHGRFVDDAAQALGAVNGVHVGTRGLAGALSFYASKLITAGGGGGAVVSRDRSLIEAIRDYLDFDCRRDEKRRFNFHLTDVQAAVGRVQLSRLNEFLARRAEIFAIYRDAGLQMLGDDDHNAVRYRAVMITERPAEVISRLAAAGITAIVPTEDWELPKEGAFPNASALARSTVSLPIFPGLTDDEVAHIARVAAG